MLLWKEWDDKEKAAEQFLVAAKLKPEIEKGGAFTYLGLYYAGLGSESHTQRALKCFQKAVSLNPDDSLSGEALCDLLDQQGKESLEVAVCREASQNSPRAFWAFQRLGYLQLHQNKCSDAVHSLQHAIRGYPTSAHLWEVLIHAHFVVIVYLSFASASNILNTQLSHPSQILFVGSWPCVPATRQVHCCFKGAFPFIFPFSLLLRTWDHVCVSGDVLFL